MNCNYMVDFFFYREKLLEIIMSVVFWCAGVIGNSVFVKNVEMEIVAFSP